ncbi:MAG: glycosyltransferase [Verrucomicrobiales bacterium]|nr:glycosyltransferase [Verrucomicrobiales bacterium]
MRILYLGEDAPHSSSLDRARALMRLGHEVAIVNPERGLASNRVMSALHYRTGYRFGRNRVRRAVLSAIGEERFDVVWVDGGRVLDPSVLRLLRKRCHRLVNYNLDDPFGQRDGRCWDTFRQSVPEYDLLCVVRVENVREAIALGARRVLRVWRGYDPAAHSPKSLTAQDRQRLSSEVLFLGTWMSERGAFLVELVNRGLPLRIYGNRWNKAPEWPHLRKHWCGPGLLGDEYVKAIQCARISLGLVSRGNRDLHTQRSAEIPYIGSLLCAERTPEHLRMYREDCEAVFWQDAEECVRTCHKLLADEPARKAIAAAGRAKVERLGVANDLVVEGILSALIHGIEPNHLPSGDPSTTIAEGLHAWPGLDRATCAPVT